MATGKLICLAVLLMVALALGEVDLGKLSHETSLVQDELDAILAQTKVNPLARVQDRPLAPRPTSEAERRMLRPILVERSATKSPLALPPMPSLLETSEASVPAIFPVDGGYIPPNLDGPEPAEQAFQAARLAFNKTAPSEMELRLRKVFPKAVVVQPDGIIDADMMIRPEDVIPRDPNTDKMLNTFNLKYGVIDKENSEIPISPLSDKDLQDLEDRDGLNEVELDYKTVFDSANQDVLLRNAQIDTVEDLDKRLGLLWNKRWEYLAAEKDKAVKNVQRDATAPETYAVDPLFVGANPALDKFGTLGTIFTHNELGVNNPVVESIPNRPRFEPETSFYGPNVVAISVDKASLPNPATEFFTPKFNSPYKSQMPFMSIIPSEKLARHRFRKLGFQAPEFKAGDEFDFNSASPAKLV